MDEYVGGVYGEGYLVGAEQTCESEFVAEVGQVDVGFYFAGQIAVADKKPHAIFKSRRQAAGRFDYVFVALQLEQTGDSNQDDCLFTYTVLSTEAAYILWVGPAKKIIFLDGQVGGGEIVFMTDSSGDGLFRHGVGNAYKRICPLGGRPFDGNIELVKPVTLVRMKRQAVDGMNDMWKVLTFAWQLSFQAVRGVSA